MKTVKFFFGFIFLVLFTTNVNAQIVFDTGVKNENSIFTTSKSIELRGSSDNREIQIEITEDGCNFSLDIRGEINNGRMQVEIFDSKGKKRGSFSTGEITEKKLINTDKDLKSSSYEERFNGLIRQKNASSGIWIVKIMPKDAYGRLMFRNQQISNFEN